MSSKFKNYFLILLILSLSGCGGGGSTPEEASESDVTEGFTTGPISISDINEINASVDTTSNNIDNNIYKIVSGDPETSHPNITPQNFRNIVIDDNGDKYAVGSTELYNGDITDGNNGGIDGLLVKFDSDDNIVWDRTIGGSDDDVFRDIAIDNNGDIYVVGYSHSVDIDISDGNYDQDDYALSSDALLMKFDKNGNKLWDRTVGGTDYDRFNSIALDNNGNIYAGGDTESSDHDVLINRDGPGQATFLVKFDNDGNILWSDYFDTNLNASSREMGITDIAIDLNNYIYVSEACSRVHKYDSSGNLIWTKVLEDETKFAFSALLGITVDDDNNIIVAGNTIYIDLTPAPWIIKLSNNGDEIWNNAITSSNTNTQRSVNLFDVKVNSSGNIYAVSEYGNILQLDSEGNQISDIPLSSIYSADLYGLTIDDEDQIYSVGHGRNSEKSGAFIIGYSN